MAFVSPAVTHAETLLSGEQLNSCLPKGSSQQILTLLCLRAPLCFTYQTLFILAHEFSAFALLFLSPIPLQGSGQAAGQGLRCHTTGAFRFASIPCARWGFSPRHCIFGLTASAQFLYLEQLLFVDVGSMQINDQVRETKPLFGSPHQDLKIFKKPRLENGKKSCSCIFMLYSKDSYKLSI